MEAPSGKADTYVSVITDGQWRRRVAKQTHMLALLLMVNETLVRWLLVLILCIIIVNIIIMITFIIDTMITMGIIEMQACIRVHL